jgi:replicative DNA helicase
MCPDADEPCPVDWYPLATIDAEARLIGALLVDITCFDHIADRVSVDNFSTREHRTVFQAINDLLARRSLVDLKSVTEELRQTNKLGDAGGFDYLESLTHHVPTLGTIVKLAWLVWERSIQRAPYPLATGGRSEARFLDNRLFNAAQEKAEEAVMKSEDLPPARGVEWPSSSLATFVDQLLIRADNPSAKSGVQTGFKELDLALDGLQPGELVVVAGRPSSGKSALAMNIATHAAISQSMSVLIFSMEMSKEILFRRLISAIAGVDAAAMKVANLEDEEWPQVVEAIEVLRKGQIFIHDAGAETVSVLSSICRRTGRMLGKLDLIIVDCLQLLQGTTGTHHTTEIRAADMTLMVRHLKLLANEMQCPVIAVSQHQSAIDSADDALALRNEPRGSCDVEVYADTILLIRQDTLPTGLKSGISEIMIDKRRNGPTGGVKLAWFPGWGRFEDMDLSE